MKLSRIEKQVLKDIEKQFPIEWTETSGDYLTKEELPLATEEDIKARLPKVQPSEVSAAITKLCTHLHIKKVYLFSPDDFSTVQACAGSTLRMPLAKPGKGVDGYQVTKRGKEAIADFWTEKAKKTLKEQGKKLVEDKLRDVLFFLAGSLFTSVTIFGFNIQNPIKPEKPQAVEKASETRKE